MHSNQRLININKTETEKVYNETSTIQHQQDFINSIDLAGLSHQQKERVSQVLKEKSLIFSEDENDTGEADSNYLKISLKDQILLQQTYN